MTLFSHLCIAAALLQGIATAAPAPAATCSPFTTYRANFDLVKAGTAPPYNLASSSWDGWTTVQPQASLDIKPQSGKNVIQATSAIGSSVSILSDVPGFLYSFYFACAGTAPGLDSLGQLPAGCSVEVVSRTGFAHQGYNRVGTFDYTVDYAALENGSPANMTKVTFGNDYFGNDWYFNVVSGPADTVLLLDNLIIQVQNDSCVGSEALAASYHGPVIV